MLHILKMVMLFDNAEIHFFPNFVVFPSQKKANSISDFLNGYFSAFKN